MTEHKQHTIEKSTSPEKLKTIGLKRFIEGLYPTCKGNHVADFVVNIASELENVVGKNPLHSKSPRLQESFLGLRGSSIKRANLGTPPGYWSIPRFFQSEIKSNLDPLTQEIVQQLRGGPDLDIIFEPKQNLSARNVFATVVASLETQGFYIQTSTDPNVGVILERTGHKTRQPYDDYIVTVDYKEIGNQNSNPVRAVVVDFNYFGKPILKVDFVQAPKDEEYATNFRLSGAAPTFDIVSFGHIHKTSDKKMLATYDTAQSSLLESNQLFKSFYENSPNLYLNTYNARIRTAYQRTMWFNNFIDKSQAFYGNYSLPEILKQINLAWANQHAVTEEGWLKSLKDGNQLQTRLSGIISGFLVGLTYDPFLFLKLAFETKLLTFLPIGQVMKKPSDLLKITSLMAKEYGSMRLNEYNHIPYEELYNQDPTNTLPLLSAAYQTHVLQDNNRQIKYTGSFIFLRALNIFLQEQGLSTVEESLSGVISLFNPMIFYQQRISESEIPTALSVVPVQI
ncbi:MAG: hypothetical protein AAB705_02755 [Patescibacteria group bacterium]